MQEMLFEGRRDGGFPASGEAGEPKGASLLAAESAALGVRQGGMPCYISLGWSVEHDRRDRSAPKRAWKRKRTYVAAILMGLMGGYWVGRRDGLLVEWWSGRKQRDHIS